MGPAELELLSQTLRKTMTVTAPGPALDAALAELGWPELLAEFPGWPSRRCSGCWARRARMPRC
ncbi:hypothetical protein [Streptomyces sp. NPDC056660]|uniref:hypothetical protein n=1 Tax=Streptomyces sp. NPDC056660 TaxID=3345897 RepID=UPI0036ADCA6B